MIANVTREEFEARVSVLEREVEGEKLVTRHVLEQARRNGDDLAAVKTRLDRIERKVDTVEHKVEEFVRDLPKIVGDAVRNALRTRGRKYKDFGRIPHKRIRESSRIV